MLSLIAREEKIYLYRSVHHHVNMLHAMYHFQSLPPLHPPLDLSTQVNLSLAHSVIQYHATTFAIPNFCKFCCYSNRPCHHSLFFIAYFSIPIPYATNTLPIFLYLNI